MMKCEQYSCEEIREFEDSVLPKNVIWGAHWRSFPPAGGFFGNLKDDLALDIKFEGYQACTTCLWCAVVPSRKALQCHHINSFLEGSWLDALAFSEAHQPVDSLSCSARRSDEDDDEDSPPKPSCKDFSPVPDFKSQGEASGDIIKAAKKKGWLK